MIDPTDPNFTLRWPPHLFAEEVERLVAAADVGIGERWVNEAETLLSQAFGDTEPARLLRELWDSSRWSGTDEPF